MPNFSDITQSTLDSINYFCDSIRKEDKRTRKIRMYVTPCETTLPSTTVKVSLIRYTDATETSIHKKVVVAIPLSDLMVLYSINGGSYHEPISFSGKFNFSIDIATNLLPIQSDVIFPSTSLTDE